LCWINRIWAIVNLEKCSPRERTDLSRFKLIGDFQSPVIPILDLAKNGYTGIHNLFYGLSDRIELLSGAKLIGIKKTDKIAIG
jgi:hypothetical protein